MAEHAPGPPSGRSLGPGLVGLPATRWNTGGVGGGAQAGSGFPLYDALAGIHLGTDRTGRSVTLRAVGVRIGVLGESLFGRLLACRLLAIGVQVTAVTRGPALWGTLGDAAGDRLLLDDDPGSWPSRAPQPLGVDNGPQALISDVRRAPPVPAREGSGRWCTAVHVRRQAPRHGGFWHGLDALLALGPSFAGAVLPVAGEYAAQVTASLEPTEIVLFRAGATEILRPDIAPAETALLTPG
ncbi:hypothetical protein [Streptomyces sp. NPDC007083]|uniref:hypothetical protein n=1 Tax=Streptomyces sp. NPDC007083 TaxID=3156913 RepID=UPI0033EC4C1A